MKDLKISKELLSEVLKSPVEIISIDECKCMIKNSIYFDNEQMGISYRYLYGNKEIRFMSIYEFAFKCKEWALSKGYSHLSGKDDIYEKGEGFVCSIGSTTLLIKDFYADTEIEATIKACNWILEKEIQEDLTEYNKLIKEGL